MRFYLANSDQVQEVTAGPAGSLNNVMTIYTPDSTDQARLSNLSVFSNQTDQTLYSGNYTYNQLDQRTQDSIQRINIGNDGSTSQENASYSYTYDPNHGDALTMVKDGNGNVLYSYSYDGVGNHAGTSLGTLNSVNEYSNLTYNGRGDLTSDANYNYGYDAQDRLISVAPKTPTSTSLKLMFGYDGQGRRDWKDVYGWNGSSWVLSYSRHYLWDGDQLISELDGSNKLLTEYTWGPTGLVGLTDYTNPGGARTYVTVADASGNIVSIVDALSGLVSASYHYDPYGNLLSATGPAASLCPFRAKGYYTDLETPWIAFAGPATDYGTTRTVYLPGGFWMERDPSGINGGVNETGYLGGDPINGFDPNGLVAPAFGKVPYKNLEPFVNRMAGGIQGVGTAVGAGFTAFSTATDPEPLTKAGSGAATIYLVGLSADGFYQMVTGHSRESGVHQIISQSGPALYLSAPQAQQLADLTENVANTAFVVDAAGNLVGMARVPAGQLGGAARGAPVIVQLPPREATVLDAGIGRLEAQIPPSLRFPMDQAAAVPVRIYQASDGFYSVSVPFKNVMRPRGMVVNPFARSAGSTPAMEEAVQLSIRERGPGLAQQQGREFRIDQLQIYEFDPNAPAYVRGWLRNERLRVEQGKASAPRTPPGYQLAHGRSTPAREGYDYSNARLQGEDLNLLEELIRRQQGRP